MSEAPRTDAARDEERLRELVEVVVAIAALQFDRRARVHGGRDLLDGLAVGINMLAEEIAARFSREQRFQRLVAQNERLIAVGQLAAGVAHEVNNPATWVLANLEHARDVAREAAAAAAREGASVATVESLATLDALTQENIDGVRRIVSIVRELGRFARGGDEGNGVVALAQVVRDAAALARGELNHRAALTVDVPEALTVWGDRNKLTQVFTNLLLNSAQAIAAARGDENAVRVSARVEDQSVFVDVRDTGCGMAPEIAARLFEPFFSTKPREQGTGLGLAISAEIVRSHGGELRLAETTAAGTTFVVRLPRYDSEDARPVAEPPAPPPSTRRRRLLLIDDEPLILTSYRRVLARDFEVRTAEGGEAALRILRDDRDWDILVCDVVMPGVDGAAVYDWILAHAAPLARRVVFCTGGAFTPRAQQLAERVDDRLLAKPFTLDELRQRVQRLDLP